ncbi:NADH-quinone oxidoreductase subunit J [Bacillus carboniphilus]|uniref:NADH-quinone oxidoreductase subunit J n=2 Tax=Bacillus carboniphilus TaxID=86663 RepID=A0ABY9JSC0_9BACI|nr:NADH-quinone oxidoreductase subunit J [Bacillus carboniphilus]WLR41633.1 NADH-quinone oxidoreductase subunit J [Bacillus carboniphilus]
MATGEYVAFLVLSLFAISGSVMMLNVTKVVHMILSLVVTFLSIACLYVLLLAEFVAVVQVLVYSGAIVIMLLFGIMLTDHTDQASAFSTWFKRLIIIGSLVVFATVIYMGVAPLNLDVVNVDFHENNTEQIGLMLYTYYIIPFELVSILLLVALVGAIVVAKKPNKEEER